MRLLFLIILSCLINDIIGQDFVSSPNSHKNNFSNSKLSSYVSSNICFTTFTTYPALSAMSLVTGDFNADGNKDIIVGTNGIEVLLGAGTGSFAPYVYYSPATATNGRLVSADFNNDGKLDICIISTSGIELFLGTGTGSFSTPVNYGGPGGTPQDLATADFNGDGNLDVVVLTNGIYQGYGILLGNGLGGLVPFVAYNLSSFVYNVKCMDFNQDSKMDLVILSGNKLLTILGNGNGTFSGVPVSYSTTISNLDLTINDFNGDNYIDIAAASGGGTGYVDLYYGNSVGTFSSTLNWFIGGSNNESIVSADFNGDGHADIACGRYGNPGLVSLIPGIGNGSFIYPLLTYTIGNVTIDVVADDFNNDGKVDIATVNSGWNSISVMLNSTPHLIVTPSSSICSGNSVTLAVAGASTYTWNNGATSNSIIVTPTISTTYSVVGANGTCTNNATTSITVQVCTDVKEVESEKGEILLYPNPFYDSIELSVKNFYSGNSSYEIYDQFMHLVKLGEFNSNNVKIEMKNIGTGMYFLRIKANDGYSQFFKIIRQD